MKIKFLNIAKQELDDAAQFYELELTGLGSVFKDEIKKALNRIQQYPNAWPLTKKKCIRKYLMHKFPYKILYSIEDNFILIIAIAHQHRKPDYWTKRNNL